MNYKSKHKQSYYDKVQIYKYSFSKAQRFNSLKAVCDKYYQLPSLPTSRKAAIGYGKKFSFEKIADKNPSPFSYNIDKKNNTKGFSFGIGRSDVVAGSYIKLQPLKTPSPTKYQIRSLSRGSSYSFISKHKQDSFIRDNNMPGPGTYNNKEDIDRFGNSGYLQKKNSMIGKDKRFHDRIEGPGPGAYNPQDFKISSKFQSIRKNKFLGSSRKTYFDEKIKQHEYSPGPKYVVL